MWVVVYKIFIDWIGIIWYVIFNRVEVTFKSTVIELLGNFIFGRLPTWQLIRVVISLPLAMGEISSLDTPCYILILLKDKINRIHWQAASLPDYKSRFS